MKRILVMLVLCIVLSVIVLAVDDAIEYTDVSKPDSLGVVTITGRVKVADNVQIKEIIIKDPIRGTTVSASVNEEGNFIARIPAKEGQDLDMTVVRTKLVRYPLKYLEPGVKVFEASTNGGYLAAKSVANAYKYPMIVGGKINFVAHNSIGPFAAGIEAGRILAEAKINR